ncbi:MAG: ROK family protein [Lentisphaerae bacterium]|nr:ROK family protein [Lentisphaerota bacterium]
MKDTKRARIIRALKQLALTSHTGISRSDAAEHLQIDLRTASLYLEQLAENGLLRSEKVSSGGKGRPCTIYRSNADNLCFLGIKISSNLDVSAVVIDAVGRELHRESLVLPENVSRLSLFSAILDMVKRNKSVDNRSLYGIGLAISRWLQPPLAGEDVYANLADYLERESGVAVHRDVNINAVAFGLAKQLNIRNLALIHTGKVIEFGLVRDGVPVPDFLKREAWLSHICVNPDGRRCYCGKYGCLENYVTSGARSERLSKGNTNATLIALGKMLGIAMVRMVRKYPVDTVLLMGSDDIFPAAEEYFSSRITQQVYIKNQRSLPMVDYAVALEASHFELLLS